MSEKKDTNPKDAVGIRKVPVSVIPANVVLEQGLALLEGACKYRRHNYRVAGVRASVYYDASMGHMMDWWEGQDLDPDSGLSHVAKAIASMIVLRDAMMREMWDDDRPPTNGIVGWKSRLNAQAAAILDRYPDRQPAYMQAGQVMEAQRATVADMREHLDVEKAIQIIRGQSFPEYITADGGHLDRIAWRVGLDRVAYESDADLRVRISQVCYPAIAEEDR